MAPALNKFNNNIDDKNDNNSSNNNNPVQFYTKFQYTVMNLKIQ